ERLAQMLEQGIPLDQALGACRGAASRDMLLAAAIGQSSGQLGRCLRALGQRSLAARWTDLLAPLVYPVPMLISTLFLIPGVLIFLMIFVMPKFQRIFHDFHTDLPFHTQQLLQVSHRLIENGWYVVVCFCLLGVLGTLLFSSSTLCWFFPGIGLVYRQNARRRVLQ